MAGSPGSSSKACIAPRTASVSGVSGEALRWDSIKPQIMSGNEYYTMRPTLMIDEADTVLHRNDELRGILNSGYKRKTAYVVAGESPGSKLDVFPPCLPKALLQMTKHRYEVVRVVKQRLAVIRKRQ